MATTYTIDEVKAAAFLADSQYDAALPGWIAALEQHVEQFTGLTLASRTDTIRLGGRWRKVIRVPGRPVSAVATVRLWDEETDPFGLGIDPNATNFMGQNPDYDGPTPDALVQGVDWGLRYDKLWASRKYSLCGEIVRNELPWPGRLEKRRGRLAHKQIPAESNIEVTYSFGFVSKDDIPPPFLTAIAAGVRALILRIPMGGVTTTSQSLDGASVGGQMSNGGGAGGGIAIPEMGDIMSMLTSYCVPKVYSGAC